MLATEDYFSIPTLVGTGRVHIPLFFRIPLLAAMAPSSTAITGGLRSECVVPAFGTCGVGYHIVWLMMGFATGDVPTVLAFETVTTFFIVIYTFLTESFECGSVTIWAL